MEKSTVIKMRDALRGTGYDVTLPDGSTKNIKAPLMVLIDNQHFTIDESAPTTIVKWDDENGMIFEISTAGGSPVGSGPNDVVVHACSYEAIQAIETCPINVEHLMSVMEGIEAETSVTFTTSSGEDAKDAVVWLMKNILNPDYTQSSNTFINSITGSGLSESDDYYNGKFNVSKKETEFSKRATKLE